MNLIMAVNHRKVDVSLTGKHFLLDRKGIIQGWYRRKWRFFVPMLDQVIFFTSKNQGCLFTRCWLWLLMRRPRVFVSIWCGSRMSSFNSIAKVHEVILQSFYHLAETWHNRTQKLEYSNKREISFRRWITHVRPKSYSSGERFSDVYII